MKEPRTDHAVQERELSLPLVYGRVLEVHLRRNAVADVSRFVEIEFAVVGRQRVLAAPLDIVRRSQSSAVCPRPPQSRCASVLGFGGPVSKGTLYLNLAAITAIRLSTSSPSGPGLVSCSTSVRFAASSACSFSSTICKFKLSSSFFLRRASASEGNAGPSAAWALDTGAP